MALDRLYLLIGLLLLAGATLWLEQMTRPDADAVREETRSTADFIGENVRMTNYDEQGNQRYELLAETVLNYPDSDITDFEQPRLRYQTSDGELRISARHGRSYDEGEMIHLTGDVDVFREGLAGNPDLTLRSNSLTVWPDTQRAATDDPVVMTRGNIVAHGNGMRADNLYGTMELIGDTRVRMP